MGRVSFGGNQDLSQLFAALYAQYEDRLESLANRAADRADEEQAAADSDMIDRWQQGEVSDEEFLAYAAQRIEQSETDDDPGQAAYWKRIQRDAEKSILSEKITDKAEDLLDRIEAGKASWDDLKRFYLKQRRGLRPNDPLYDQISDQIEEIDDRIAQGKVEGAFAKVDYQFRAGQLTGSQAGAQLRALAQQFRQNDPARYWQILAQAADLERYGGSTYGSGGGSGGGSGSGSSSANLNAMIDALEGQEYRLESSFKQFQAGDTTGTFTYETEGGKLRTEEVLLRNPDGTPTAQMQALTNARLENFDRLIIAYGKKGDRSQRDLRIQDKAEFITNEVQPMNTIGPELQQQHLMSSFQAAVEAAANSDDPILAWNQVKAIGARIVRWEARLNTQVGFVKGSNATADNPELGAARRRTVRDPDAEDRTTTEFAEQSGTLTQYIEAVMNAQSAEDLAGAEQVLAGIVGPEQAARIVQGASIAVDLVTGIPQGKYVRAFVPGEGLVWTPMAQTVQTVPTEQGPIAKAVMRPVRPDGSPLWDESKGQDGHLVLMEVNGRVEPVWSVSETAYTIGGNPASAGDIADLERRIAGANTEAERAELQAQGEIQKFRQMLAPGQDGNPRAWYYDENRRLWFKGRVTEYGGVPVPFIGVNGRKAQKMAETLAFDQNGNLTLRQSPEQESIDPTGKAYFNATVVNAREKQAFAKEDDWYRATQDASRTEARQAERVKLSQSFKQDRPGMPTQFQDDRIGNIVQQMATKVGVSLTPPTRQPMKGFTPPRFNMPDIKPVNVVAPKINLPKITLPRISMNFGSSLPSQLQTGANFTEGFGNSRFRGN